MVAPKGRALYCIAVPVIVGAWSPIRAQPFSDNFSGTKLKKGWIVSSPNPDSSVELSGTGYLDMVASPKNGGSDLWPASNYNAPVVLQPISSTVDWTVTTEVSLNRTNQFQGAGLLLATQPGNFTDSSQFLRLDEIQYQTADGYDGPILCITGLPACITYTEATVYMRVTKKGDQFVGAWSDDGKHWHRSKPTTIDTPFTYIGLDSLRQPWDGDLSVYTMAEYNYFKIKVLK